MEGRPGLCPGPSWGLPAAFAFEEWAVDDTSSWAASRSPHLCLSWSSTHPHPSPEGRVPRPPPVPGAITLG